MSVLRISCPKKFARVETTYRATILLSIGFMLYLPLEAARAQNMIADYDRIVAEAKRCTADEPCIVAGGVKGCRCPTAVRVSQAQRVSAMAQGAMCPQIERLYCPPLRAPRCIDGRCAADVNPP